MHSQGTRKGSNVLFKLLAVLSNFYFIPFIVHDTQAHASMIVFAEKRWVFQGLMVDQALLNLSKSTKGFMVDECPQQRLRCDLKRQTLN